MADGDVNNRVLYAINDLITIGRFSKSKLADSFGIKPSKFSEILNKRMNAGTEIMVKLCQNYHISSSWLLTGDGSMYSHDSTNKSQSGIPLIPNDAFAGYGTVAYGDLPVEDYYTVTEFRNADFLIRVKGDSMTPKFNGGDIVACKLIKELTFFQWNRIYVIYTESQGILIKRVMPSDDKDSITLVSDNKAYQPFDVPKSEISAIALVLGAITLE